MLSSVDKRINQLVLEKSFRWVQTPLKAVSTALVSSVDSKSYKHVEIPECSTILKLCDPFQQNHPYIRMWEIINFVHIQ